MANKLRAEAISGGRVLSTSSSIWARTDGILSVLAVQNDNELVNVTVFKFNDAYDMTNIITAERARFIGQKWQMQGLVNRYPSRQYPQ